MEMLGYKWCESGKKHRYIYLRATKKEKKLLYMYIYKRIQPYPKVDKKVGLTENEIVGNEEKPTFTQMKLF